MGKWKKITGNGNMISENRTVSNFDGIGVGGSFDVVLVKGKEGNIVLEGESNILPYVETTIENNTLQIKFKKNTNIKTTKNLTVTVSFDAISKVSLGGSGNLSSSEIIKGSNFNASIGGSGNIDLEVDVDEISSSIGGSGSINLKGKAKEF
ncbi:MAG: DUF2807 domain-containing protein [Polaribacter sp.]|nr:DUF2807 domain-containing protein [Polaribacter sp.]